MSSIVWNKILENCSISLLLNIIFKMMSSFSMRFNLKQIRQIFDEEKQIFLKILIMLRIMPIFVCEFMFSSFKALSKICKN